MVAARLDFGIAISAVFASFFVGSALGSIAGFYGGWADRIIGRVSDTIMAFPLFVLAMGIVAALGNTVANIVLATAIINLPFYIRVSRAEVNVRRNAGYVEAARLAGNSDLRTLALHVFPNVLPPMMVQISLNMGWAILNAAGLSFIGLGVRPPRRRVGHHGRRGRDLHHLGRMVGGAVPRRGADARGVLLQPARRRTARHHGSKDADVMETGSTGTLLSQTRTGTQSGLRYSSPVAIGHNLGRSEKQQ